MLENLREEISRLKLVKIDNNEINIPINDKVKDF